MEGQSLPSPPAPKSPGSNSPSFTDVSLEIRRPKKSHDGAASQNGAASQSEAASQDEAASPADPGTLKLRESGTSYVQSAHWEAILTKIRGLKEDLVADSKAPPGSCLFYGPNHHATRDEILTAVPPRPVVDRLMALHFDSYIITPCQYVQALFPLSEALTVSCRSHSWQEVSPRGGFFQTWPITSSLTFDQYETFWKDPSTTSIAWIGLMFSMLYIAALLQTFTIDFTDGRAESVKAEYLTMKDAFREKAVQCLILARYTMGGPYILETLIMVLTGEFILLKDGATDGWLLISMILHLAIRMGYHRDPDNFPGISPFEGEMRRRIWATIVQLDLALSLEMGLPRSATDTHIDTKLPRNLRDCGFEEDTTEMPPPRPETEWTPVLPLIAKRRLMSPLGLICDINTDINPPSYDEVVKVDALLKDAHKRSIPPVLRWETMPHPITDSPSLVVQRVSIETTYYKSRILLYRRALVSYPVRQPQERDRESVRICLDSALKILSFQQMLHEESQPFGRLSQLRWKVTHIFNQDVLLATSVLCLYLQDVDKFEVPETAGQTTWSPRAEEIRQRLTISHMIWLQMSTASAEAGKVAKALSIVLGNTEASTEDGSGSASYDFLADFDTIPLNGFGATFNHQCKKHTRSCRSQLTKRLARFSFWPLLSSHVF